jgi:mycothiol synthase
VSLRIEEWHSSELGKPPGLDALVAAAIEEDGRKPIDESALAELKAGAPEMPHAAFVARDDEGLIGYAHVSFRETRHGWRTDLVVHPRARHEGVGSELTRKVFDHVAWDGGGTLHLWVPANAASSKLAERFGFVPVRRLHQQHAPLPAPTNPIPYEIKIRPFTEGDQDAWLEVHNSAFGSHPDAGGWTGTDFDWRTREPWFDAEGLRLAFDQQDQLLGSCWMKIHAHADPAHDLTDTSSKRVAEIYMMGVAPQARGRGLAPALASDGLAWGVSKGADRAMLYVDESNEPAMRLYRGFGFRTTAVQVCLEVEISAR